MSSLNNEIRSHIYEHHTPLAVAENFAYDEQLRGYYLVVVKALYDFQGTCVNERFPELAHILTEDIYYQDHPAASLRLEQELIPYKPLVDLLLFGDIVSDQPLKERELLLQIHTQPPSPPKLLYYKAAKAIGERFWQFAWGPFATSKLSATTPFTRLPLIWERSFGGNYAAYCKTPHQKFYYAPNPLGRGHNQDLQELYGQPAPNFLSLTAKTPTALNFAPVKREWQARAEHAGTYDATWAEEQAPFLAKDFNPLFYNTSPLDQRLEHYPANARVTLNGFTSTGLAHFTLPPLALEFAFYLQGAKEPILTQRAEPDTIVIYPAEQLFSLTLRSRYYLSESFRELTRVTIQQLKPSPGVKP